MTVDTEGVPELTATAPGDVREQIAAAPGKVLQPAPTPLGDMLELTPTPAGEPLTNAQVWDETSRPMRAAPSDGAAYSPRGLAAADQLKQIHQHLRRELQQVRDIIEQVGAGSLTAQEARVGLGDMTVRQNNWTLGAYCASYCTLVTAHHGGEDSEIFPLLRRRQPELMPVLDRLEREHRVIHDVLDAIDRGLVGLVNGEATLATVGTAVDTLSDALLSHLAYEESQLLAPLARHFA